MSPTDLSSLGKWLAWFELAFGTAVLVAGLRGPQRPFKLLAPLGAWFVLAGLFHLLGDTIPAEILIPIVCVGFAALAVWFVREYRASRARTRALLKERGQSPS